MDTVIRVEHLSRSLSGEIEITLVDDISLEIQQGEFLVISGPSGSGKSSLLYLLGLLDRPSSGKIWLNGQDITRCPEDELATIRLSQLGYVFQFHFLLPEFTALENVMLPMQRLGKLPAQEITARAQQLLSNLGLASHYNKFPKQLSGGQSQRVAIARALANEPLLILADEPTGNLDTTSSANVEMILRNLAHEENRAIAVVTHDPSFAKMADRAIHIVDGKIQNS
ncbi:ABC transporter ATP-binding protein [Legionella jordanis]|uniref:ABC transporter ATP binding protein n=1 Tax=Legionella jordanis TaxID=456 RepID=A0A0W0VCZ0_9GAMM|nr:ABC transporter ATP-binding protein [Legionella jordanis]KTD17982.1 ABC transporter ATP binding protein [Legionella jordanis]RMX02328.1 ABC transporter ATP-binding protein [Legionella jordanis]RMX15792.1 ABC transporter ATP-binding protein [Legionella jordanis]VEH13926.1 ABC transporter ATP binding protein [Legionella jordanis]HAT8714306.1 ATP-binding cassette domain-containing protein [Legionella jordanis]